ncbi:hypothetical protein [uncultured Roseobacter sp.]|uniref:hypothetical protein n=1 Tax=uncultured Roseobacter sp. TaxID=114847 RepID=UPI0026017FC3|nr:hypothetical protein [uncultured Roseobacter sp.]
MPGLRKYERNKKSGGRFVQLHEWLMCSEAWKSMKSGPRALSVEIKRRYNGRNNGEIVLSHRQAAVLLNAHRNTVGAWFNELLERGLIELATGPCLGVNGSGSASQWRLTEEKTSDGLPATRKFWSWCGKSD